MLTVNDWRTALRLLRSMPALYPPRLITMIMISSLARTLEAQDVDTATAVRAMEQRLAALESTCGG